MHYSIRLITLKDITANKIVMSCFRDAWAHFRSEIVRAPATTNTYHLPELNNNESKISHDNNYIT